MKRSDFSFDLPEDLIAQQPASERSASRMLVLNGDSGEYTDSQFVDLPSCLKSGDVLVFNNTRVIPARLYGQKESGGKFEMLVERIINDHTVHAHIRSSKSPRPGASLLFENDLIATMTGREGDLFIVQFETETPVLEILQQVGHIPLPPYIQREDQQQDHERYQTVYAEQPGAVAAPTAGLHFDKEIMRRLETMGVEFIYITLHVGAGTFQPVRVDDISEHHMHKEWIELSQDNANKLSKAKQEGRRIIAVGTTSVRCLESVAALNQGGELQAYSGDTDIFITPGFQFNVIDALITNFHLSESTLLMLVAAFAGYENIMRAYHHAIEQRYRFFSYGDAMFISRKTLNE